MSATNLAPSDPLIAAPTGPVYLDGFATSPLAEEAKAAIIEAWSLPTNSSSPHLLGERATEILESARADISAVINAAPSELVFTSGATEANNLAILGVAEAAIRKGSKKTNIVVSSIEHSSVLGPARSLARRGFEIRFAQVGRNGVIDLAAASKAIDENTLLVSVMLANNEIGVVQPISDLASIVHSVGASLHCDAAQAVGKIPVDVISLGVDYMSISAHKLYGPMGVGALFFASTSALPDPINFGGGQEQGVRPGTIPIPLVAGFGAAARLALRSMERDMAHAVQLTELFLDRLREHCVSFDVVASGTPRLPGSLALCLNGADAQDVLMFLARTVQLSSGSACDTGTIAASHVLAAIQLDPAQARSFIRMYFGRYVSEVETTAAASAVAAACLRAKLATGGGHQ